MSNKSKTLINKSSTAKLLPQPHARIIVEIETPPHAGFYFRFQKITTHKSPEASEHKVNTGGCV